MIKNFMAMPIILRLISIGALAILLIAGSTALPGGPLNVFGRVVTRQDWWSSGAGTFVVVSALMMSGSAIMMIRRSRHARLAHVIAWIAVSVSIPFVASVTGVGVPASKATLAGNLVLTCGIALYLYVGQGCREYFRSAPR